MKKYLEEFAIGFRVATEPLRTAFALGWVLVVCGTAILLRSCGVF